MLVSDYEFQDWGLIDYSEALKKQEELVESIIQMDQAGTLVFCQHPEIVTLGRATEPGDLTGWRGQTLEVSRGGRATYHGPSQLVIYPIINLTKPHGIRKVKDIGQYLRLFEQALVESLEKYGISAIGKSRQQKSLESLAQDETGVWVGSQKIASLGIAIRKWVSYHGAAVNIHSDPSAFKGLKPCGFSPEVMVSLENLVNHPIDMKEYKNEIKKKLMTLI